MPMNTLRLLALCLLIGVLSGCKPPSQPAANTGPGTAANTAPAARSADEIALLDAAIKGDKEIVKTLLDQGVNPNTKDGEGRTPMTEAAYFGHLEIVKMLIFKGGDIWAKKQDGATPIILASDHPDVVKLMKLSTDLIEASRAGDNKTIVSLLDQGAYVNAKDVDGRNGLTEATWENHVDTVKLLLEKGANPNTKKNDGVTPLSIATGRGHKEIEELLKKAGAK